MTKHHRNAEPAPHEGYGVLEYYIVGFILSIILTIASYLIVVDQIFSGWHLLLAISSLAFIQAIVQLVFFLHLGSEPSPYWNLTTFLFMVLVLVILVAGTIWIMYNLDYLMVMS